MTQLDDELFEFLLSAALDGVPTTPPASTRCPRPDPHLLGRAAAAHRILKAGHADGPLLLSLVCWPSPAVASASAAVDLEAA